MGAGVWQFYYNARDAIGRARFNFAAGQFVMRLYTNSSNCGGLNVINASELFGELAAGNGYTLGGKPLTGVTWAVSDRPDEFRFDCDEIVWTATGGNLVGIRWAVIHNAANGELLCVAELDTAPFTVPNGNILAVSTNVGGVFELN